MDLFAVFQQEGANSIISEDNGSIVQINRRLVIAVLIGISGLILIFALGALGYFIFGDVRPDPKERSPIYPIIFLLLIFSLGSLSAISAFYYYFPEVRNKKQKEFPSAQATPFEIVRFVLSDDEALVLDAIRELKDRTYQFEIARVTGLSRMKVHRTIKKLEDRQIVSRDKDGRGSRVFLNDWLL